MALLPEPSELFREIAGRPAAGEELREITQAFARWRSLTGVDLDQETLAIMVVVAAMGQSRSEAAAEGVARRLESAGEAVALQAESIVAALAKKADEAEASLVRTIGNEMSRHRIIERRRRRRWLVGLALVAGGLVVGWWAGWRLQDVLTTSLGLEMTAGALMAAGGLLTVFRI